MKKALAIFFSSRLLIVSLALFFLWLFMNKGVGKEGFFDLFYRWDAVHYMAIVKDGYTFGGDGAEGNTIAFFPLFPLLVKLLSFVFANDLPLTALSFSFLVGLLITVVFVKLYQEKYSEEAVLISLLLLFFGPLSIFLSSFFTEGLFILITLLSFLCFKREQYLAAILFSGLGAVVRPNGFLIAVALFWAHFYKVCKKRSNPWSLFLWVFSLFPILLFMLFQDQMFNTPFAFIIAQNRGWQSYLVLPYTGLIELFKKSFMMGQSQVVASWLYVWRMEFLIWILALIFYLKTCKRYELYESLFIVFNLLLYVSQHNSLSVPRFVFSIVPFYPVLAETILKRPVLKFGIISLFVVWSVLNTLAFFAYKPIL